MRARKPISAPACRQRSSSPPTARHATALREGWPAGAIPPRSLTSCATITRRGQASPRRLRAISPAIAGGRAPRLREPPADSRPARRLPLRRRARSNGLPIRPSSGSSRLPRMPTPHSRPLRTRPSAVRRACIPIRRPARRRTRCAKLRSLRPYVRRAPALRSKAYGHRPLLRHAGTTPQRNRMQALQEMPPLCLLAERGAPSFRCGVRRPATRCRRRNRTTTCVEKRALVPDSSARKSRKKSGAAACANHSAGVNEQ